VLRFTNFPAPQLCAVQGTYRRRQRIPQGRRLRQQHGTLARIDHRLCVQGDRQFKLLLLIAVVTGRESALVGHDGCDQLLRLARSILSADGQRQYDFVVGLVATVVRRVVTEQIFGQSLGVSVEVQTEVFPRKRRQV